MTKPIAVEDEEPGRLARIGSTLVDGFDYVTLITGMGCVGVAVTVLFGWPWALLLVGVYLIVLATVVL